MNKDKDVYKSSMAKLDEGFNNIFNFSPDQVQNEIAHAAVEKGTESNGSDSNPLKAATDDIKALILSLRGKYSDDEIQIAVRFASLRRTLGTMATNNDLGKRMEVLMEAASPLAEIIAKLTELLKLDGKRVTDLADMIDDATVNSIAKHKRKGGDAANS